MALLDALSADLLRQVFLPMLTDECASAGPVQNFIHVHGCAFLEVKLCCTCSVIDQFSTSLQIDGALVCPLLPCFDSSIANASEDVTSEGSAVEDILTI